MPKDYNKKRDASRPTKSSYRGSDSGSRTEKSGEKKFSSDNFRSKSSDRPIRKSYASDGERNQNQPKSDTSKGWNTDRPKKNYSSDVKPGGEKNVGEKKSWDKDRPKKNFSSDYKPREEKASGERKSWDTDRPKKNYSSDYKPREEKTGSERKNWDTDKPKKNYSSDYKPREEKTGGERKSWDTDRPKKNYSSDFKPREEKAGSERKSWDTDRPKKAYSSDFKSREEKTGSERKSWDADRPKKNFSSNTESSERNSGGEKNYRNTNRPIKKFENKGSKYSPENFSSSPENIEDGKPRRARITATKRKNSVDENDVQYGTVRLNKYIANAGICSRREADVLIETGAITVNGKIVSELGYKVSATDIVAYGGQGIRREKNVYLLLNKPKDYITTADDPLERKTVMHLIKGACKERVYPVGRLDRNSTGLLILTNDGELTKKLTHPRYEKKKIYHIELDRPLTKEDMNKILEGVELEDGMVHVDEISYVTGAASKKEVGIELHSGKNRVIRRIFEHLNYDVKKLDRVYFAGLSKKDLPRGRWRFLTDREVAMLNSK
jgi:23S rRNA pseudouridine2605 synthase